PFEIHKTIIEKLRSKGRAFRSSEVIGSPSNRRSLAGGEHILVIVDQGAPFCRNMQPPLLAVAAQKSKIGMPTNTGRKRLVSHIFHLNVKLHGVGGKAGGHVYV